MELSPSFHPRITDQELAALRAGRLPIAEAARWVERARGLAAPAAPPRGPLEANETGWLLGFGPIEARLAPARKVPPSWWSVSAAVTGATISQLGALAVELSAGAALALVAFSAVRGAKAIARRRLRALQARPIAVESGRLFEQPAGEPVRITGVIAPGPTFPSLFRGVPSVLTRNQAGGADERRGIDFTVLLEDGARVRIEAPDAFLLDRSTPIEDPPACGPVYVDQLGPQQPFRLFSALHQTPTAWKRWLARRLYEVAVGPGDRVEVVGVLHREVAPDGVSGPGRKAPLRLTLRASEAVPVCVRRSS